MVQRSQNENEICPRVPESRISGVNKVITGRLSHKHMAIKSDISAKSSNYIDPNEQKETQARRLFKYKSHDP